MGNGGFGEPATSRHGFLWTSTGLNESASSSWNSKGNGNKLASLSNTGKNFATCSALALWCPSKKPPDCASSGSRDCFRHRVATAGSLDKSASPGGGHRAGDWCCKINP